MKATRLLTSTFTDVLATPAKLNHIFRSCSANLPQANKARRLRVARLVALLSFTGLAILIPSEAQSVNKHSFTSKDYIRSLLSKDEALCLIRLYGKESAFNVRAIGNINGSKQTYGIPQLKNPMIKDMSAYNQIDYGIKYIEHRYGSTCLAYEHWVKKGWH